MRRCRFIATATLALVAAVCVYLFTSDYWGPSRPTGSSPVHGSAKAAPDEASYASPVAATKARGQQSDFAADNVSRQHVDLGNLDNKPWNYSEDTARQTSMPTLISQQKSREIATDGRSSVMGPPGAMTGIPTATMTDDGPLGQRPPTKYQDMPGPGDTPNGPSPADSTPANAEPIFYGPEHGTVNPASPSPSKPGANVSNLAGPGSGSDARSTTLPGPG